MEFKDLARIAPIIQLIHNSSAQAVTVYNDGVRFLFLNEFDCPERSLHGVNAAELS